MIMLKVNLVLCKQEKVKKLKGNKGRNHQVKWYVVGKIPQIRTLLTNVEDIFYSPTKIHEISSSKEKETQELV